MTLLSLQDSSKETIRLISAERDALLETLERESTSRRGSSRPPASSTRSIHRQGQDAVAFSKPKALLRKAAERTIEALRSAIGRLVDAISPDFFSSPLAQAVEHLAQVVLALPRIRA